MIRPLQHVSVRVPIKISRVTYLSDVIRVKFFAWDENENTALEDWIGFACSHFEDCYAGSGQVDD